MYTCTGTHRLDDGREDAHAAGVRLALVDEEDGQVELLGHARLWVGLEGCGCCVSEGLCLYVHIKRGAQRHQGMYQLGEVLAEALLPLRELAAALWWLCLWLCGCGHWGMRQRRGREGGKAAG